MYSSCKSVVCCAWLKLQVNCHCFCNKQTRAHKSYWQSNNLATAVNLISCLLFCDSKINVCDEEEKNALIQWFTSIKLSIFSSDLNDLMLECLWQLYLLFSVYCLFFFRFEWFDTGASSTVVLFVFSLFQGKDLFVSCFLWLTRNLVRSSLSVSLSFLLTSITAFILHIQASSECSSDDHKAMHEQDNKTQDLLTDL